MTQAAITTLKIHQFYKLYNNLLYLRCFCKLSVIHQIPLYKQQNIEASEDLN